MSLKENIEMVKEELNSEEKFFEKAVITERFVKKYKNVMIGLVVVIVVVVIANIVYDANRSATIEEANQKLNALNTNASNANAATQLQNLSPDLFDVWSFSIAMANNDIEKLKQLQNSKAQLVSDLATYQVASSTQDLGTLDTYSMNQGAIYKDLATIQSAIILLNKNEIETAHQKLRAISQQSPLNKIVLALLHYGVK